MGVIFLYDVEFVAFDYPPDRKDEFEEALKKYFASQRLNFLLSGLGGMIHSFGIVYRKGGTVVEEDRRRLAGWIGAQPIRGIAKLGNLEEETDSTDYLREITEWVFPVDNLTDEDRMLAAAYRERISRLGTSPREPVDSSDI